MFRFRIKDLIDAVYEGEDYFFYCPVFLDGFYAADNHERFELIKDEPDFYEGVDHFYYCDVAAIAHKLANDYQLPVPEWVHDNKYILQEPHYELDTKNEELRNYYREVSPYEFKIRNIFVDTNALNRV